jgi:hypothetical protein
MQNRSGDYYLAALYAEEFQRGTISIGVTQSSSLNLGLNKPGTQSLVETLRKPKNTGYLL